MGAESLTNLAGFRPKPSSILQEELVMASRICFNAFAGLSLFLVMTCSSRAQPILSLKGSCPGSMRADVRDAPPFRSVALLFALEEGHFVLGIPGGCPGTELGLGRRGLRVAATAVADENGVAYFVASVSPGACGSYLQILTSPGGGCQTSNVVRIE